MQNIHITYIIYMKQNFIMVLHVTLSILCLFLAHNVVVVDSFSSTFPFNPCFIGSSTRTTTRTSTLYVSVPNTKTIEHDELYSDETTTTTKTMISRKKFFRQLVATTSTGIIALTQQPTFSSATTEKRYTNDELKNIVRNDIIDKQFLATGQITKSIYDPKATFTDEIDTYELEQWVKGTQKLFVGEQSTVRLVKMNPNDDNADTDDIQITDNEIIFYFDEDLMFNIPFRPIVSITGKVILKRDPMTGLIVSYREFWDQDIITVLKSAKF